VAINRRIPVNTCSGGPIGSLVSAHDSVHRRQFHGRHDLFAAGLDSRARISSRGVEGGHGGGSTNKTLFSQHLASSHHGPAAVGCSVIANGVQAGAGDVAGALPPPGSAGSASGRGKGGAVGCGGGPFSVYVKSPRTFPDGAGVNSGPAVYRPPRIFHLGRRISRESVGGAGAATRE